MARTVESNLAQTQTVESNLAQTQTVESNIVDQLKTLPQGTGLFRLVSMRHGFPVAFYQLLNPPAGEAPSTSFAVEGSSPLGSRRALSLPNG